MTLVKTICQIFVACLTPNIGGWIAALFTSTDTVSWYGQLNKPSWNPPTWLFFPAWTVLYILMGYASYRVWKAGHGFNEPAQIPLIVYSIQVVLNWFWTPIFFGRQELGWAFGEIVVLWVFIIATTVLFYRVDKIAALLFVPYIAWVTFASVLNYALWDLNKKNYLSRRWIPN